VATTLLVAFALAPLADGAARIRWAALSLAALGVVFGTAARRLDENHAPGDDAPDPRLGVATHVTLGRGVLLAWVAGFLLVTWTEGIAWLAWLPALLYGAAAALDAVDGAVARRHDNATVLGARLDMAFDAFGLLVAPVVAVAAGQLPWWYLSVSLARYVFVAGLRLREHRGLPVADLPPRASRRVLAGLQMAFVAVALTPVVSPALGRVGAGLFGGAVLAGFVRDWLYVSGRLVEERTAGVDGDIDTDADADERPAD
jgi:CDP-diacylglycerol--glycerol-3-phosphate 3-phosphatidyltransferase